MSLSPKQLFLLESLERISGEGFNTKPILIKGIFPLVLTTLLNFALLQLLHHLFLVDIYHRKVLLISSLVFLLPWIPFVLFINKRALILLSCSRLSENMNHLISIFKTGKDTIEIPVRSNFSGLWVNYWLILRIIRSLIKVGISLSVEPSLLMERFDTKHQQEPIFKPYPTIPKRQNHSSDLILTSFLILFILNFVFSELMQLLPSFKYGGFLPILYS